MITTSKIMSAIASLRHYPVKFMMGGESKATRNGPIYSMPSAFLSQFPYVFLVCVGFGIFRAIASRVRKPKSVMNIGEEPKEYRLLAGVVVEK